jgi:carboxymethylenebutenolidase
MRILLLLAFGLLFHWNNRETPTTKENKSITVCHSGAIESFAALGANPDFVAVHPNPKPYEHISEKGKAISFKASDGKEAYGYHVPADKKTDQYIFVFHEWYGLNDYVKKESEKLQKDLNVNVLAIDLYDGKVADNRDDASKYMQAMEYERGKAIIEGALEHVGADTKVATIGWCFGGGWSLQASLILDDNASGCVMYYGMPEKDVDRLKTLQTDVLGIFASQDQWINEEVVDEFKTNMKAANKDLEVYVYDAGHGFANPSNPIYDKEATKKAYKHTLDFLKAHL